MNVSGDFKSGKFEKKNFNQRCQLGQLFGPGVGTAFFVIQIEIAGEIVTIFEVP